MLETLSSDPDDSDPDIPMNRIDDFNGQTYFKLGYSNESLNSGYSSPSNNVHETRVAETLFSILVFLSTINNITGKQFDSVDGFHIISKVCLLFSQSDTIGNLGLLMFKQIFVINQDPENLSFSPCILAFIQECGTAGSHALLEKAFCFVSYLCKQDARWKSLLVNSGIIPLVLELWKLTPIVTLKKTILQTLSQIMIKDEEVKETILKTCLGYDPFMNALISCSGSQDKLLWALIFELSVVGSFLPIIISSEELMPAFKMEKLDVSEPSLLYQSTLQLTRPRKSNFAYENNST